MPVLYASFIVAWGILDSLLSVFPHSPTRISGVYAFYEEENRDEDELP